MRWTDLGYVAFELIATFALVTKIRQYGQERKLPVAIQAVSIVAGAAFIIIPRFSTWVDTTLVEPDIHVPLTEIFLVISTVCVQSLVRIWASGTLDTRYRWLYWGSAITMIGIMVTFYIHSVRAGDGFGIQLAHGRSDIALYYAIFFAYSTVICAHTARVAWERLPQVARTAMWSARGLATVTTAATIAMGYGTTRLTFLFVIFFGGHFHDAALLRIGSLCLIVAETTYIVGITFPPLAREWTQRQQQRGAGTEATSPS